MDELGKAIVEVNNLPGIYKMSSEEEKAVDRVVRAAIKFDALGCRTHPESEDMEQIKRDLLAQTEHAQHLAERLKATSNLLKKTRKKVATENKPLSLDELRQMDGEPAYSTCFDGSGGAWGIVHNTENGVCADIDEQTAHWFDCPKPCIAYAHKPEEEK